MSGRTEWAAITELEWFGPEAGREGRWVVIADGEIEIATGLYEPEARLIAASSEMQKALDLGMEAARAFEMPPKPTMFSELFADFQYAALESLAKSRVKP